MQNTMKRLAKAQSPRAIRAALTQQLKRDIAQALTVLSEDEARVMYMTASTVAAADKTPATIQAARLAFCVYAKAKDRARYVQMYGRVI